MKLNLTFVKVDQSKMYMKFDTIMTYMVKSAK